MAFASYHRLPYLRNYAEALAFVNKTAPIRGREDKIIPLGARKDVDKFNIYMTDSGNINVVNYKHVLLTYFKTGGMLLTPRSFGWCVTDAWILEQLLPQVLSAQATRGYMRVRTNNGDFVYPSNPPTEVSDDMTVLNVTDHYVWRIDRTNANIVRSQYGKFYRYVKGMIGVRKDELGVLTFRMEEFREQTSDLVLAGPFLKTKPPISWTRGGYENQPDGFDWWTKQMQQFINLITPNPDEGVQARNFYEAFVVLAASHVSPWFFRSSAEEARISTDQMLHGLDELVFKFHSDKVFVKKLVPAGSVPNDRYRLWVTRA